MYATCINVERFIDYGIITSDCIMVSDQKCDVNGLIESFCQENGLNGLEGNQSKDLSDITELFKIFLKKNVFKILKCSDVLFSD